MPDEPPVEPTLAPDEAIAPGVRVQILATEHWSLLATRSTAQAEVLSRIAILLTFVSATAVSLALVGQATDFDDRFSVFAVVLLCLVLLVGTMTLLRVHNASEEDYALVVGMNRLRAAYTELDPALKRYFVASAHDDDSGVMETYNLFRANPVTHLFGSTGMLVMVVNSAVAGVLSGVVASAAGAGTALTVWLGAVVAVVYLLVAGTLAFRRFLKVQRAYRPLFPSRLPPTWLERRGAPKRATAPSEH
jgi:hypothetical protein